MGIRMCWFYQPCDSPWYSFPTTPTLCLAMGQAWKGIIRDQNYDLTSQLTRPGHNLQQAALKTLHCTHVVASLPVWLSSCCAMHHPQYCPVATSATARREDTWLGLDPLSASERIKAFEGLATVVLWGDVVGHLNLDIRSDIPNRYYILSVKYFAGDFFSPSWTGWTPSTGPRGSSRQPSLSFCQTSSWEASQVQLHWVLVSYWSTKNLSPDEASHWPDCFYRAETSFWENTFSDYVLDTFVRSGFYQDREQTQ